MYKPPLGSLRGTVHQSDHGQTQFPAHPHAVYVVYRHEGMNVTWLFFKLELFPNRALGAF